MTAASSSVLGVGVSLGPPDRPQLNELGPIRMARYLTREAAMFLYAGVRAYRQVPPRPAEPPRSVGVVCGTRAAGLREYAQMYRSGRTGTDTGANPMRGPQSSFNAPASHLSLHLGAQGACLTMAGGCAGLAAVGYAQTLLRTGRVAIVLAGGVDLADPATTAMRALVGPAAATGEAADGAAVVLALTAAGAGAALAGPAPAVLAPVCMVPVSTVPVGAVPVSTVPVSTVPVGAAAADGTAIAAAAARAATAAGVALTEINTVVASDPATAAGFAAATGRDAEVADAADPAGPVAGLLAVVDALDRVRGGGVPTVLCVAAEPGGQAAAVVVGRSREAT